MTIAESLSLALQYLESGQRVAAEQLCRQILQQDAQNAEALNLLGILAYQTGRHDEAAARLEAALALCADDARFHHNMGMVRQRQGRPDEAIASYQRALTLEPNLAQVHNNLGNLYKGRGQAKEALASYDAAIRLAPGLAEAHNNRGNLLAHMGRMEEAEQSCERAVQLRPSLPQPHYNLGLIQARQDRLDEATRSYREALRLWPDYAEAHIALGETLMRLGRLDEAEAHCRQALRLWPDKPLIYNNLGVVLGARGPWADMQVFRPGPSGADTFYDPIAAQQAQRIRDEALACHEQAVRMQPDYVDALNNLGNGYLNQGRNDEALACYRKVLAVDPGNRVVHSSLLFAMHHGAPYDPEACFAEHLRWAEKFGQPSARPPQPVNRDPERRLRIGYVSADFNAHVMGRYIEVVIAAHDRTHFEIFCYANLRQEDSLTQRVQASADRWRSVMGVSAAQAAAMVRADQIDLLIDLSGHTADNRLDIFALKPAPVQVAHAGYPDTTGLTVIDYRLMDPYTDPPGRTERFHTEKIVRLPEAHWCYAAPITLEIAPLPARQPGAVTLGSFNTLAKVTEPTIAVWARILHALPQALLLVQTGAGSAGDARVRAAFAKHGVGPERVTLTPRLGSEAYFRRFGEVDICLDTYPYTGCNTTADALWMGVPVVTRAGPTCVTRLGVSAIVLAGLEDLVTESPEAYVETTVRLAQDIPRLRELRQQLRDRVKKTLGNVPRFTHQLEAAYRDMWHSYCAASR
jgi:protein O-GlcNAc transferase